MVEVYKEEEQKHGSPVERGPKQEGPARNPFTQNTSAVTVPVRAEKDPTKQKTEPLPPLLEIKGGSFQRVRELFEAKVAELAAGDKKKAELVSTKLDALFGVLKAGGELKLQYDPQPKEIMEKRETRTPQEVLDSHSGDCNELSMLFVVCAEKLGMGATEMSMLVMDVYVNGAKLGSVPPKHAALITTAEGSYLIDPALLGEVKTINPKNPKEVSSSEISGFYTTLGYIEHLGIIAGVQIKQRAVSINEMLAVNLMESVSVLEDKLKAAPASEKERIRLQTIGILEASHEADGEKIHIQRKLIAQYLTLADDAFSKGEGAKNKDIRDRYFAVARHYCDNAIELYEKRKSQYAGKQETGEVIAITKNAYAAHDVQFKTYTEQGKGQEHLDELDKMIEIRPDDTPAYLNKISFYYGLAGEAAEDGDFKGEDVYHKKAYESAEVALRRFASDPSKRAQIERQVERMDMGSQKERHDTK